MNRYDERRPRYWRHERGHERGFRNDFRDEDYRFREGEDTGRTAGDPERQPFAGNPYGYYPGQGRAPRDPRDPREWRERDRWSQPYGQREPYNARGGSGRAAHRGRGDKGSRYSESQYGTRRGRFEPYAGDYEPQFGEGPFADTSESPGYFGSGNYGDGGASYTGGFDERSRRRNPGSLGEDTFSWNSPPREQRRYRTGPKGYVRSDERIREDICERLMLADGIDSSDVTVSVKDRRITLEGTVPTRSMKHEIEDLADYTAGVEDVDNRIRVERQMSEGGRSGAGSTGIQSASGVTPTTSSGGSSKTTKQ